MRTPLLIVLAAAIALPSAATARDHHRHRHDRDRHHERHRYDRHHHRHHAYVAPYRGWDYRRLSVGYRLRPAFYGPRYIITDYGYYGLRAPGRHFRWIRYGNDLLLVDIRYGRVVQVLPGRYYY